MMDRQFIRDQASHEGEWVRAQEWYDDAIQNNQETVFNFVTVLAGDDQEAIRTMPPDLLDCVQRLALLAIHELAVRWHERNTPKEPTHDE